MNSVINYTNCPVCHSDQIHYALSVRDYSVSQEVFEVWECRNCSLRFTQNAPDQQSIGPYYQSENYISHSNTARGIVNRMYHAVRSITLKQKRGLIQSATQLPTGTLLDIGAGTGAFASFMQSSGWRVTGLEPDDAARKVAQEVNGVNLLPAVDFFDLPPDSFDAITMWHVLEHVHQLHQYTGHLQKLLKKNGRLFIAVPNYQSLDAEQYKEFWAAYDVPRHLYHFSSKSIQTLLSLHSLKLESIKPMWFDSFYVSMLSEKYKTGNASVIRGGWKGFRSNLHAINHKDSCSSLIYVITKG